MAQKRSSEALAIWSEPKRVRNELQPVTNKDKELMEVVRNLTLCTESEANKYIYVLFFFVYCRASSEHQTSLRPLCCSRVTWARSFRASSIRTAKYCCQPDSTGMCVSQVVQISLN